VDISGGWHHGAFPFSMEFTVVGDQGTFDFHSGRAHPSLYVAAEPARDLVPAEAVDGYKAEIEYFVDCASRNQKPARCLPQDSARAVELALLLLESRTRKGQKLLCQL